MNTYFENIMLNNDYENRFSVYISQNLIETNINSSYCDVESNLHFLMELKNSLSTFKTIDEKKIQFINKIQSYVEKDILKYKKKLMLN